MKNLLFKSFTAFALITLISVGLNAQTQLPGQEKEPGQGQEQLPLKPMMPMCPMGHGYGHGFRNNPDRPCLNLSDEQQEQMKTLQVDHFKKLEPLKNKMAELKAQQKTLMSEAEPDMKLINKNIDEQTALMNRIQKLQAEHRLAVKGILTDEQEMMLSKRPGACRFQGTDRPGPRGACQFRSLQ